MKRRLRRQRSLHLVRSLAIVCLTQIIWWSAVAETQKDKDKDAKQLPVSVVGSSTNALSIQWEELQAGIAGFSIVNGSPDETPKQIEVEISPLILPSKQVIGLRFDRETKFSLDRSQAVRFNVVIPNDQTFRLQPGTYSSVLTIRDQNRKFLPVNVSIQVAIPAVQPAVSKATLIATRINPLTTGWRGSLIVPLSFPSTASELPRAEVRQGIVRKESGGLATVNWTELKQASTKPTASCCAELTVNSLPSAGRYEGEINFGSSQDKNSILTVTVIGTDCVIWPILVTLLGILLAYAVNRYVGVLRETWTLRRQEAELDLTFGDSQAKFASAIRNRVLTDYDIAIDIRDRRKVLRGKLNALEGKWTTDLHGDPDYTDAVTDLQSLENGIALWAQFGTALRDLQNAYDKAKSEVDPDLKLPRAVSEPKMFTRVDKVLRGSPLLIEELTAKLQTTRDNKTWLEQWTDVNQQAKDATISLHAIRGLKLNPEQVTMADQADKQLVAAWGALWNAVDSTSLTLITAAGTDLPSAETKIAQVIDEMQHPVPHRLSLTAVAARTAALSLEESEVTDTGMAHRSSGENRAAHLDQAIRTGDIVATSFAFIIALLTGLSLKYFGQPFGTIQDYLGLFLWAAGTKATLDIVTSFIGRFSYRS